MVAVGGNARVVQHLTNDLTLVRDAIGEQQLCDNHACPRWHREQQESDFKRIAFLLIVVMQFHAMLNFFENMLVFIQQCYILYTTSCCPCHQKTLAESASLPLLWCSLTKGTLLILNQHRDTSTTRVIGRRPENSGVLYPGVSSHIRRTSLHNCVELS